MRRTVGVSFLITALVVLCSSPSEAQVALDAIGVLEQYCGDNEAAPHPKRIVMRQLMTDRTAAARS
jgi:hypothetical protein